MPCRPAIAALASDVATADTCSPSATRAPTASMNQRAVVPVPRPSVIPSSTSRAAASPAARLAGSRSMTPQANRPSGDAWQWSGDAPAQVLVGDELVGTVRLAHERLLDAEDRLDELGGVHAWPGDDPATT